MNARPGADRSPEAQARQGELEIVACLANESIPALNADFTILDVGRTRHLVHRAAHRHLFGNDAAVAVGYFDPQPTHAEMIGEARLVRAAFETSGKITRCIGGHLCAEQVDRRAEPEIDVTLKGWQIDRAC